MTFIITETPAGLVISVGGTVDPGEYYFIKASDMSRHRINFSYAVAVTSLDGFKLEPGDKIVRKQKADEAVTYEALREGIEPVLSEDVYKSLPQPLKSLYAIRKTISHEEIEVAHTVFSISEYLKAEPEVIVLTGGEVALRVGGLLTSVNKQAKISYESYVFEREPGVKIEYFSEPWDGSYRRILKEKPGGGPYKDRRGRDVPDYPSVTSRFAVPQSHFDGMSAMGKEDLDRKLRKIAEHLIIGQFEQE